MANKLQLKPGQRILVINAPARPEALLGELPAGAALVPEGPADAVVLFVRDREELERHVPPAAAIAAGDKLLWVAYPKGGSGVKTDINRDGIRVWVEGATDLRTVTQVAIDSTWTALRLREAGRVGS